MHSDALRVVLEQAHRILFMEGLAEDSSRGHVTARDDDGLVYIKPWGMGFEKVRARDFQKIDLDGSLREGEGKMHSERVMHCEILRQRKDVQSVVHVHPYYSILLSSVFKGRISIVSQHGARFFGKIPFYPASRLIQSKETALDLAKTLGGKPLVLMKNHGIVAVGGSIAEAVFTALHFERAARAHLEANLFGKPSGMSQAEARKMAVNNNTPAQMRMLWDYYLEKLNRTGGFPSPSGDPACS